MLKWQECSIEDWIEIQELISDELTSSELALELELLFNEDFNDEISASELRDLRKKWEFVFYEPKKSNDYIDYLPFKTMSTATYIDLDTYLTKYKLHEVIEKVVELLFGDVEVDNICQVFYGVTDFLKYRKELIDKYKGIFGGEDIEDDDDEIEEEEEIEEDTPHNKWGWLAVIYNMAGGDITKTDAILNKSFISVLNWASMRKDFESRQPASTAQSRR